MATDHVIDIIIETSDRTGGGLDKVRDKFLRFDQSIQRTNERLQRMTNRAHEITMSLIDKVTPAGSGIQRWLMRMAGKAHQVTLSLNDRATSQIRATEARLFQMTAKAYTVTVNLKDRATKGLKNLGNNALMSATGFSMDMLAGAGIGYGIYDTVKTYKNFEAQMSTVGAISGASAEQMQKLTEKAMEMGAKTSFSATEAGKAFEYMATAGWKTDQMMSGIEGIMNLAAASGEDLGSVSDIVTDSLTAFGLQASDATHFSDVLAAAASNSNTNVGKMGYTFQYVAPIAGAMGQSIEDTDIIASMGEYQRRIWKPWQNCMQLTMPWVVTVQLLLYTGPMLVFAVGVFYHFAGSLGPRIAGVVGIFPGIPAEISAATAATKQHTRQEIFFMERITGSVTSFLHY